MKTICWFLTTWDEPGLPSAPVGSRLASWVFQVLLFVFVAFNVPPGAFGESASPTCVKPDLNLAASWSGESCDTPQEVRRANICSVRRAISQPDVTPTIPIIIWTFGHVSSARSTLELASMLARAVSGLPSPTRDPFTDHFR